VTAKKANPELLENFIQSCNVVDAIDTYDFLVEQGVDLEISLRQDLLEVLCFHNNDTEEIAEDFNETAGISARQVRKWNHGGKAEHLATEVILEAGLGSPAAAKARLALLCGRAKFGHFDGALSTYEEILANNGSLDTAGYNAVIVASGQSKGWDEVRAVLIKMSAESVKPDRYTLKSLLAVIGGLDGLRQTEAIKLTLSTLAEFRPLGLFPSLADYRQILITFGGKNNRDNQIINDVIRELEAVQVAKGTPI
jgi:pentatricopeptide repeat domain-containing protein 3